MQINQKIAAGIFLNLLLVAFIGCQAPFTEEEQIRPNILFVLSDDQSWLHTGAMGDSLVNTPAFDRIANEGILFTHSFSASPSCTPSRSAIISGQDIWRLQQGGVLFGAVPPDLKMYPQIMAKAGYHVGYTGKGWAPGKWNNLGLENDPIGIPYKQHLEGVVAEGINRLDYAANFETFMADRNPDQPFCFWFGATEPHRIYQDGIGKMMGNNPASVKVPDCWPRDEIIQSDILDYLYEIEWYDTHLAGMLETLEETGELDNTLIIVTSDNGMPFPRAKVNLYDLGVRMPLAICWGDKIKGGRIVDDLVSHTDFAPTILEAAGLPIPPEMTGKSLMPILLSQQEGIVEPERNQVFSALERHTWCRPEGATYPIRSIRTREYLYIRNFEPDRWPTGGAEFVSSNRTFHGDVDACPTKSFLVDEANQQQYAEIYQLNFGKRPPEELYKIDSDPFQVENLAGQPEFASVKKDLWRRLKNYLLDTGDPRIQGKDPWQQYIYHQADGFGASYNRSLSPAEVERAKLRP